MADTIDSLHQTHHSNPSFEQFFHFLDPISLIHMMERGPRYRAYADLRENKLRMKFEKLQQWEEIQIKQSPVKKKLEFSSNSGVLVKRSSVLMQSVPHFSSTLLKENRKPLVTGGIEPTPPRTAKNWSKANGVLLNSKQQRWEETEFKQTPTKKQVKFNSNSGVSSKGPSVLAQSVPDFSATLWKENRQPAVIGRNEMTPPSTGKNWSNSRGSKSANSGEKKKGRLVMGRKSYASVEELKAINGGSRGGKSSARLF
ncbi:hypothetical protein like AT5G38300 [Hibiscus trionum]|uniref:Uncharacterized protein n=1 Tax=Hibiscus trionum TaxID=183268 RepID=A0A9W7GVW4_HIBTR|nr:hypothetical protein like AT5G38300 [Hibiscus trionum]